MSDVASLGRDFPFDDAGDIAPCDPENDHHYLVPITKFAWLTSVKIPRTLDRGGEGAAVVVFGVLQGGRRSPSGLV